MGAKYYLSVVLNCFPLRWCRASFMCFLAFGYLWRNVCSSPLSIKNLFGCWGFLLFFFNCCWTVEVLYVVVVQLLDHVQLFVTPWTAASQASLSFTISWSLLKLMCIESVMPSNHLILCHHLLLLPSVFLSIRVISNELALCTRWTKYWSFSFSISPSSEYSGLISFRIVWFDLLAVQGTLFWTTIKKHWLFGA